MKRYIDATVECRVRVALEIDDPEQDMADPNGKITDGEAATTAIVRVLGCTEKTYPFDSVRHPAVVSFQMADNDIRIEGECEDE